MRHDLTISGPGYRLRPVCLEDAQFIVALRTDPDRNRFINYTSSDLELQMYWIRQYFERPGDYYFIVENLVNNEAVGTIGIYNLDTNTRVAEWGRWVIKKGSKAGVSSIILLFNLAFRQMGLEKLSTHTIVQNRPALAILEFFGMREVRRVPNAIRIGDTSYDAIEHEITRTDWLTTRKK